VIPVAVGAVAVNAVDIGVLDRRCRCCLGANAMCLKQLLICLEDGVGFMEVLPLVGLC
jgi:hypothetical protein